MVSAFIEYYHRLLFSYASLPPTLLCAAVTASPLIISLSPPTPLPNPKKKFVLTAKNDPDITRAVKAMCVWTPVVQGLAQRTKSGTNATSTDLATGHGSVQPVHTSAVIRQELQRTVPQEELVAYASNDQVKVHDEGNHL